MARLALGAEVHPGVALDADEVVALGRSEERVLEDVLGRVADGLSTLLGLQLGHRERQSDRERSGTRPQRVDGQPVGPDHGVVDRQVAAEVVLDPGRELADACSPSPRSRWAR